MTKSGMRSASILLVLFIGVGAAAHAQAGFGGPWGHEPRLEVFEMFDKDNNGRLNDREMQSARNHVRELRGNESLPEHIRFYLPVTLGLLGDIRKSAASAPKDRADLYDENTFRTLYLRFSSPGWFDELTDFFNTDVEVPANLIVDGEAYPGVGVHFRGSSSYFMTRNSPKKSFNISIDYEKGSQRLYGYRTLNLLNNNADPSFLREVLFSRISRSYIPALKANFVKLVINGENWGVYTSVEQFNNDFLSEWFGTSGGVRWKIPPGRSGPGALFYNGPDPEDYKSSFELQTDDSPGAWYSLIELCSILTGTPDGRLEEKLNPVFDIDGALWLLALENIFIDGDGYISRGSDYSLYQDPRGRFHMISRDNNETFRYATGGGPNQWPDNNPMLDPLGHLNNPRLPVISRLLALPRLRARYLAHMKTIVEEWLDWNRLKPVIESYRSLIAHEVKADDKKLYSWESFEESFAEGETGHTYGTPGFEAFVTERREFLLSHPALSEPDPDPAAGRTLTVTAGAGFTGAEKSPVVINELMAINTVSVPDPQGQYDDWIELHNPGSTAADLSGMYLSDKENNPRKWAFPRGASIPAGGYLLVWADENEGDRPGIHLNFRLSGKGERLLLIDTDERGNRVLDAIDFGKQAGDTSYGRLPDGTGEFRVLPMTPGRRNER